MTPRTYCSNTLAISIDSIEVRMSHWIDRPKVTDLRNGAVMLDLSDSQWDLMGVEEQGNVLELRLRKYPGTAPEAVVRFDLASNTCTLDGQALPLATLQRRFRG